MAVPDVVDALIDSDIVSYFILVQKGGRVMELQKISQVSRKHGISLRMLRYYEKEGLLESRRKDDYAYRVYDETAIDRLRQIIFLRKLRIPTKQIKAIFESQDAAVVIDILHKYLGLIDEEVNALSTIKAILEQFMYELEKYTSITLRLDALDESLLSSISSLSFTKHQMKESLTMDALDNANDVLNKLHDVRIIFLPPMSMASVFCIGKNQTKRHGKF